MAAAADPFGISMPGVPPIAPSVRTPQRDTRRKPKDDRNADDGQDHSEDLSPPPPGIGILIDKIV
jgi:hypothetical protein